MRKILFSLVILLCGVGYSYGVFTPSGDITNNNNLVNSQCSGHITLSDFIQTTNGVPIFNFNFVNGSICDSIINNTTNTINVPSIVCGYFDRGNHTSSATATLVGNAMGNSYWNIKGTSYVSLANSHCVFVRTGNKLEFGMSNSFNLNNISGWTFGYTIMPFDTINTYFQVPIECSQYTSLECQTEYNLIPISSVDQNYCVNNNLCPSSGGGDCGTGDSNWSALYINDIQHLGKPIINITIPEEIDWDYINTGDSFDLDVVGYNVDYEAMSETLSVQKYRPTSEDFTKVVSILAPYMKILLFLLFAYIVIKRLKKPFSSKLK